MSITQGLFSDVLANAPGGGSADWSKTLPMAGAVDWTKVNPFQVINPLTGYNFGATQATPSSSTAQPEQPMSEYQKWLAQQSQTKTSGGDGGGRDNMGHQTDYGAVIGDPSASGKTWGELTAQQQAAYSAIADPYGIGSMISKGVQALVPGASFIPGVLDNLMGRTGAPDQRAAPIGGWLGGLIGGIQPTSTNAQIANAFSPESWGNFSTNSGMMAPTGGGIAANPMAVDPATRAAMDASRGDVGYDRSTVGYDGPDRGDYF